MTDTELVIGDLVPQPRQVNVDKKELAALVANIRSEGLRNAIIVVDGVVVDGLKRVEAYKALKLDKIPAFVSDNFGELADRLKAVRGTDVIHISRAIEIAQALWAARTRWNHSRRVHMGKYKVAQGGAHAGITSRELMARATGLSPAKAEILGHALRYSLTDPEIRAKLEEIKSDKLTLFTYASWHRNRDVEMSMPVISAEEARGVTDRGLRALATTIEAMGKFGSLKVLTMSERANLVNQLNEKSRATRALATLIQKGMNEELEEQ